MKRFCFWSSLHSASSLSLTWLDFFSSPCIVLTFTSNCLISPYRKIKSICIKIHSWCILLVKAIWDFSLTRSFLFSFCKLFSTFFWVSSPPGVCPCCGTLWGGETLAAGLLILLSQPLTADNLWNKTRQVIIIKIPSPRQIPSNTEWHWILFLSR